MANRQYIFQPFKFQTLHKNYEPLSQPIGINECVVCTDAYLIAYEGPNLLRGEVKLWKFNFDSHRFKTIICRGLPQDLTSITVILSGNLLFIYGVPRGVNCYSRVYCGNLNDEYKEGGMEIKELKISSRAPVPRRECSQSVVLDGSNIYVVGGAPGNEIELDVFQLDLITRKWLQLYTAIEDGHPNTRDSHQTILYNNRIYTFYSRECTNTVPYNFSQIHTFNLVTSKWEILPAMEDYRVPLPGYPINRVGQNCVQCPKNKNLVYLCGGYNNYQVLYDMWQFDLDTTQWKYLPKCIMPVAIFNSHAIAVSDSGLMCCYGGRENDSWPDDSNDITTGWIVIPKLKVICWEAMIFYFKDQMIASSNEELKKIGLPIKYYNRIIDAKAINA